MAQLTVETILLLDSFGGLDAHVRTGDQVLVGGEQLAKVTSVLDKNQLRYESAAYSGLSMIMLTIYR